MFKLIPSFDIRNLILIMILICITPSIVFGYPQDQLRQCVLGSKQNPILLGVPESSIENYCDCVLNLIIDEKKEARESANKCGLKYFK